MGWGARLTGEAITRPGGAQPEELRGMPTFQNPVDDAADALTRAADALDRVWEAVNAAWSHNGAIAWQPDTPPTPTTRAPHPAPGLRGTGRSGPGRQGRGITGTPPLLSEHGIGM